MVKIPIVIVEDRILDTRMKVEMMIININGRGWDSNQSGSSVTLDASVTIESDLCSL